MGIVNVTPDSFSDGGRFFEPGAAVEHALKLVDDGADILDVGGESTRPGAELVPVADEIQRVVPVIERLCETVSVPVSVDTMKAKVAFEAIQAGAAVLNDVSALADPGMLDVCRKSDVGIICMHMQGTPKTMQVDPRYRNVVEEVADFFAALLRRLEAESVDVERVVLDPGIGFGKTAEHNLDLLSHVARFRTLGRPVLVGHSRKRFLQRIIGRPLDERTFGTMGVSVALAMQSVDMIRVHDVRATRDVLLAWHAIADRIGP